MQTVKHRHFTIQRLKATTSTQDEVRRAAAAGAPAGFCCVADQQTAGRGRQGRRWVAPPGTALLASVLLEVSPAKLEGIPFAAGLAVAGALAPLGVSVGLKWPNDVVAGGRKLAGILAEIEPRAGRPGGSAVVVGLGLNLTVPAFPEGVAGVSLHELTRHVPPRERVLTAWLDALDQCIADLEAGGLPATLSAWRRLATGLGEAVTVVQGDAVFDGVAEDVEDDGSLRVRTAAGVRRVIAGDVHLRTRG